MTTVKVFAPAKINLALHVTGRRDDGFHEIDSLVVFARDLGDFVSVSPNTDLTLSVTGPMAGGAPQDESNLAIRAARMLRDRRRVRDGAKLTLDKRLPIGSGIGGGSSDAAATINALSRLWNVQPLSGEEALSLGADVPVCLAAPKPSRMRGIGEWLGSVPPLPAMWLVLANPGVHVSTARVFKLFDEHHGRGRPPMELMPSSWDFNGFHTWLAGQINDLRNCTTKDVPAISDVLDALRARQGCMDADMSGSGSTCWGLFQDEAAAQNAARHVVAEQPGWWVRATAIAS